MDDHLSVVFEGQWAERLFNDTCTDRDEWVAFPVLFAVVVPVGRTSGRQDETRLCVIDVHHCQCGERRLGTAELMGNEEGQGGSDKPIVISR